MKVLICMSNVPDTTTKIRFKDGNTAFDATGVQWIINPWDELALTRALQLKEEPGSGIEKVTVITVGLADAEPTIRKALAIGADDAIRVNGATKDAFDVARQIAEAIRNDGYDLIMCGIESSDYNNSMVGGMIAEILDIPSVSSVSSVKIENGQVNVFREIDGGKERLSVEGPFVAVVQKGIALEPRIPSMRGIMMARTKTLKVVEPTAPEVLVEHLSYELPPAKAKCRMVTEDNARELVRLLHTEAKVI